MEKTIGSFKLAWFSITRQFQNILKSRIDSFRLFGTNIHPYKKVEKFDAGVVEVWVEGGAPVLTGSTQIRYQLPSSLKTSPFFLKGKLRNTHIYIGSGYYQVHFRTTAE